ncbi:MAG: aldehyde reductase [Rhizobiales bacterium]|nr:aldehyde reductase [Hyphomicrobiales bacterium]OJU36220.1 MAG: epimerase [Rhizobiales bacterium 68-8]
MSGELVLVTGGSGFIGAHCIMRLLADGHMVRTTVRSRAREADVREMLRRAGAEPGERLEFAEADLTSDAGWAEAVAGCAYVLHVASPFPVNQPRDADELVRPAREGTLRVLKAARDAGVRRVVQTSSFAAVGYGHPERATPFDETDWTNLDGPGVTAYVKSKTLAERAAWDFVAREGSGLELATVNPVGVLGPVLGRDLSSSVELLRSLMEGAVPAAPRTWFGLVDVRDVADLHVRAMTSPAAKGERFIATGGDFLSVIEMARILRAEAGPLGKKAPSWQMPDCLVRLMALFMPAARATVPELGKMKNATSAKAKRLLGWAPRTPREAILASAESLVALGIVRQP